MHDTEKIISRLVQIGIVQAIEGLKVRVKFPEKNTISGLLPVLQRPDEVVSIEEKGSHVHTVSEGSCSAAGIHSHKARVVSWMPKINDRVVVIYLPILDGDGFVIGGLA